MLFQKNILKKYLSTLDSTDVNAAWNTFKTYFHNLDIQQNIRNSKEEQFQEGFLRELFVNVLGYTLNPAPDYNLITEQKNETNSKKADGAIIIDGIVTGVIELKDHKTTDLSKIENQAFGYKAQNKNARYIIISNFEKLRLYIDNAVDFEEFHLFTLDFERFKTLYLALNFQGVKNQTAVKMKSESLSREEQITNLLYKDYSEFKQVLYEDILRWNEDGSSAQLYKKTQKLLDRFLFIFFAEDCGLLPPNTMIKIIDDWHKLQELDEYQPLYNRIKKYFNYLDTGYKGKDFEIFAYNGGLFKPDQLLDSLKISDQILETHTRKLSEYDYESEVDVNILGHIFENSLNDEWNVDGSSANKRKRDGVFYTPQYITKYIVDNTVGKLCAQQKTALGIVESEYFSDQKRKKETKLQLLEKLDSYRKWLLQITILDPACGSGAFLNAALKFLMAEHRLIDEMEAKITGAAIVMPNIENAILENNLYGVDINDESVEIAKLSLWLRTAKPQRKLNSLNNNIKCGNSLISDPAIAGEKAFDWQKEFPQVFAPTGCSNKGGFDVVIGNPPYVSVEKMSTTDKEYYKNTYKSFYKRSDLFALFVENGLTKLTKNDSQIAFIIPSIVLNNLSYSPLRDLFLDNKWLAEVSYVGGGVFADATVDTSILIFNKVGSDTITLKHAVDFFNPKNKIVESGYFKTFNNAISVSTDATDTVTDKMFLPDFVTVDDYFTVFQGIVTGNNDAFIFENEQAAIEKGIEKELLHPFCLGRDIGKWEKIKFERKILYLNKDINIEDYQGANNWLLPQKDILNKRRECAKGVIPWYSLQWPRIKSELDTKEKILIQRTRNESLKIRVVATIDTTGIYNAESIINVIPKTEEISIYFLLALLNSKLMNFLFTTKFLNLSVKGEYLKQIRFPKLSFEQQRDFIDYSKRMLGLHNYLDNRKSRFFYFLTANIPEIKLTAPLQNFETLEFKDFLAELKKQKQKPPLSEQDEWDNLFYAYKKDCTITITEIENTEKEIDKMVYALYGLTEEEVGIVEGK